MNKAKLFILTLVTLIMLTACGVQKLDADVLNEAVGTETGGTETEKAVNAAVDIDLTQLSSTMVYSEVYNMMTVPEKYIGKTVKMSGMFVNYTNQDGSMFYPACVIADATACCSQGIEFVLTDSTKYPEEGSEITVIGTFEGYEEDGLTYYHLVEAERYN